MAIIQLSTLSTYWQNVSDWVKGVSSSQPKVINNGRQQQILSSTPLIANATYTSTTFDSLTSPQASMISAQVFADQVGTIYMDSSMNNINWDYTQFSMAVSASTPTIMPWQPPLDRYYRFRFINGATAQGTFRLSTSSTNDAGIQNVNASMTGSLTNICGLLNVTTAGTRIQLPNISCREVTIIAKRSNTGYIYAGNNLVSSTNYGVELAIKESFTFAVSNANLIYIDSSVSGEGISYVAI